MEIYPCRNEKALPDELRPVLEEGIKRAVENDMTVPHFVLSKRSYKAVLPLFERVSSRLVGHPLVQSFSAVHVLVCGKKTPPQSSHFLKNTRGTTISKDMIALFLEKPKSQEAINEIVFWTLPHEFYHVMRMKSEAFTKHPSIGSTMIEEGLAQVFQIQEIAREGAVWAQNSVTNKLSHLDKQCMADAQGLWPKLDVTDFDYKDVTFGDGAKSSFPFYDFSFALVAATLIEKKWSVMDREILDAPHSKILDLWHPARGGTLDLKSLPERRESIKRSLLSPQP